jgi:hypothetical protein
MVCITVQRRRRLGRDRSLMKVCASQRVLRVWSACDGCWAAHGSVELGFRSGTGESKGGVRIYEGKVVVGARARVQRGVCEAEGLALCVETFMVTVCYPGAE